jgi:hypothetical protein
MTAIIPRFRDNKDRIVYLAAEYKTPISITVIGLLIFFVSARPELPTVPESWLDFIGPWVLLALPSYALGIKISQYLFEPDWERVAVLDPGENEIYDGWRCPRKIWNSKTVMGATPLEPDEGIFDSVVTRWNWYGDIGELEVRGCEKADMTPGEADQTRARVDEYYEDHHAMRRSYSRLKSTVLEYASRIHDLTIMRMMEQREAAEMELTESVTDLLEQMEEEVNDLPSGPAPDNRQHIEKWGHDLDQLEIDAVPPAEPATDNGVTRSGETASREPSTADGGTEP